MKILVPIPVDKRLPEFPTPVYPESGQFSKCVIVLYVNKKVSETWSATTFAYCDKSGRWEYGLPPGNVIEFSERSGNKVVEWYDEIELESLFPDDDLANKVATNASDNRIHGTLLHQEGQAFFKNHLLKNLQK